MISPSTAITNRAVRRHQNHSSSAGMGDSLSLHRSAKGTTATANSKSPYKMFLAIFTLVSFLIVTMYINRMSSSNLSEMLILGALPSTELSTTSTSVLRNNINKQTDSTHRVLKKSTESQEKSFLEVGRKTGTDKVQALFYLPDCLKDDAACTRPSCERENCRPWGHFYHTIYQQRLGKYTLPSTEPFQMLEIGFFTGKGYQAYQEFFSEVNGAELHSMEISCLEHGPREKGLWPWGNFANASKDYDILREKHLLHCGDASNVTWLDEIYAKHMHRPDAPPLKIVVEDGSHLSTHMVQTMFFWFPRIEPGGMLVVEDIQPIVEANSFRTQFLPQIMSDLHFCGDPQQPRDEACFPQIYPYLQSIHCEMHICIFERNQQPAVPNLSLEKSKAPPNALDLKQCYSFANAFGSGL